MCFGLGLCSWLGPKQNARNIYFRADDKRCILGDHYIHDYCDPWIEAWYILAYMILFYVSGPQGLGVEEEGGSPAAEVERGEGKVEAQQGDRISDEVRCLHKLNASVELINECQSRCDKGHRNCLIYSPANCALRYRTGLKYHFKGGRIFHAS